MISAKLRNIGSLWLAVAASAFVPCRAEAQQTASAAVEAADQLAAAIDRRIVEGWERNQVEPAPPADDAEFLRRTYLNIAGRIPSVSEVLEFLDDASPNKRQVLVERLLDSPGYLSNFTTFWRDVIIPEAVSTVNPFNQFGGDVAQFEVWLRERLDRNAGIDRIAREVISGTTEVRSEGNPAAFVRLKEAKAENLAAGTSRAFLGVRLECAQCHNHPFAKWQREDFWRLAAFYGGNTTGDVNAVITGARKIAIPETDKQVEAAFLDASVPDFKNTAPRTVLANWVVSKENSYFARATANRFWGHFFGIGLVDPIDDFDERNPASHPELLDELAQAFVSSNYDQKLLIRAITRSRAYQLTSRRTHDSQQNPRLFAKMLVKGMTSDQLFDSLIWATGGAEGESNRRGIVVLNGQRQQFRELFSQQVSAPGEVQTSILQALLMMNGAFVDQASSPQQSMTLSAIIEVPFFNNEQRLETLYLAALARPPRPDEAASLLKYVEDTSSGHDWKQALGDVYWALLNSSEFLLNH